METTIKNIRYMVQEFIQTEPKLLMAWVSSGLAVIFNRLGFDILDYELWKIITIDILTVIMIITTIGYTIARWRKLNKSKKNGDS